jgi:predicted aldo/keto reductase-like oxidoreductase
LGKTGLQVSTISLGTEHLVGQPAKQVETLLRAAVEKGVNYFDLVFAHPELRDLVARVFRESRDQVIYAVHLGSVLSGGQYKKTRDPASAAHYFEDFLKRFGTDHADVLFLHSSDGQEDYDSLFAPDGLYELALSLKKAGKARFLAFSGHTVSTALLAIAQPHIDVLMFPINLASHRVEGKRELLEECRRYGTGLVGMKPFAGGRLLTGESVVTLEHWQSGGHDYCLEKVRPITAVQCVSYALAQPGVTALVPGFESDEQLRTALEYFVADEVQIDYSEPLRMFKQYSSGECVYCNHCLPCPARIDVAAVMQIADASKRRLDADLVSRYASLETNAADCVECGACERRCPFGVGVIEAMRKLRDRMG